MDAGADLCGIEKAVPSDAKALAGMNEGSGSNFQILNVWESENGTTAYKAIRDFLFL